MTALSCQSRSASTPSWYNRWAGQTVICLASGPSLTKQQADLAIASGHKVIVTNSTWQIAPDCDVIYGCDHTWWNANWRAIDSDAERWTQDKLAAHIPYMNRVLATSGNRLSRKPGLIYTGRNSGFQIMQLAYQWGAKRILLAGYDMQFTGGKAHWHTDHRGMPNASGVAGWAEQFEPMALDLLDEGVEVINCTRETALKCFPRMSLEGALCIR